MPHAYAHIHGFRLPSASTRFNVQISLKFKKAVSTQTDSSLQVKRSDWTSRMCKKLIEFTQWFISSCLRTRPRRQYRTPAGYIALSLITQADRHPQPRPRPRSSRQIKVDVSTPRSLCCFESSSRSLFISVRLPTFACLRVLLCVPSRTCGASPPSGPSSTSKRQRGAPPRQVAHRSIEPVRYRVS